MRPRSVPCFVIVWFYPTIIRASIESLLETSALDMYVTENRSRYTDSHNKPYFLSLLEQDKIAQYRCYDKNIASQALKDLLFDHIELIQKSPYVVLTDGDVLIEDGWLDDAITLLDKYSEVFAVGTNLSSKNLPLGTPHQRAPTDNGKYLVGRTGLQIVIFRGNELYDALQTLHCENVTDRRLWEWCSANRRVWARLRHFETYHLTWDVYKPGNEYYDMKCRAGQRKMWDTLRRCGYTVFTKGSSLRIDRQSKNAGVFGNSFGE